MKNKIRSFAIALSFIAFGCFAFAAGNFVAADSSDVAQFSKEIVAVTPSDGEEVSLVNKSVETLFDGYNGTYSSLSRLFYNNEEMAAFPSTLADPTAVRALYDQWDTFRPVNNVLKWEFDGGAINYDVTVSKDSHLSTFVYKDTTDEKELYLENVLYPDSTYYWQVVANLANDEKVYSEIFTFDTKDTIRTVEIDGASNTRDIGGFITPYGKTQYGLIYRGARLDDVTAEGIAQLNDLRIKSDVDLRSPGEGAENPSGRENNYAYLDMIQYDLDGTVAKTRLAAVIKLFANPDNYPIYFHCAIGRDRTGTLSFVLNNLLGVSEENIISEYFTSMFSVTGALATSKEDAQLFQALKNMFGVLDRRVDIYNPNSAFVFEGETRAERTASYLISIGVTQEEITAIRNIMTGKTAVLPADAENPNGYQNKRFVTFLSYGMEERTFIVNGGTVVSAPYALPAGYVWTVGGVAADLNAPITVDTCFIAKKQDVVTVTTVIDGESSDTLYLKGAAIELAQFDKEGYNCFVINTAGDIIKTATITADKDLTLNIIYIKK